MKETEKVPPVPEPTRLASTPVLDEIELLCRGEHPEPFRVLGPHPVDDHAGTLAIRAFQPQAQEVTVLWGDSQALFPAVKIRPEGLFEALIPRTTGTPARKTPAPDSYRIRLTFADGRRVETYDPYAFPPLLTDYDLHLMGEGTHYLKYEKLGAHVREIQGISGVHFAVWAPNARRVSVVGDFNHWDGRMHPMRSRDSSGVWELFIPGLGEGLVYKFEVLSRLGGPLMSKS